jgi:RNA-directed DNA polymerase
VAKQQPDRRFTLLYDKVCRHDILQEAWQRVKSNKGAAGVDQVDIDAIRDYGEDRFLREVEEELRSRRYRAALVRRVHIPKPGQPGKTRPLGIPTVRDRVVQMAVKLVVEPLFEADFIPCSFGFRPKKTPRMALSAIVQSVNEGYSFVVDVDLKSYLDTASYCPLVTEKIRLLLHNFDSQAFTTALPHQHGFEFSALDTLQHRLP